MRRVALSLLLILLSEGVAHPQPPEYQVKAAMLANFALFVVWPTEALSAPDAPFAVCVLGSDPFGPWLEHEFGGKVGTHPVQIRRVEKVERAQGCHLIFLPRSEQPRMKRVLSSLPKSGALVVTDASDSEEFCRGGGMIALLTEGGKLRFVVNADAASSAGLTIDSRLKRMARSSDCGGGK